ncbi:MULTISPECIES: hypothetical protein [Actinosynnema]|uniref:hypothetical protein n=1 Tax=Actinosynnema TaxID=40566 RepID=UPI0020A3E34C|nr:hypothetical protein [Actinosynnema pretiosum]MCP2099840.1 hypothetical protein [Actinosynnema pretiosum]
MAKPPEAVPETATSVVEITGGGAGGGAGGISGGVNEITVAATAPAPEQTLGDAAEREAERVVERAAEQVVGQVVGQAAAAVAGSAVGPVSGGSAVGSAVDHVVEHVAEHVVSPSGPGRRVQRTVNFDRDVLERARAAATYLAAREPGSGVRSLADIVNPAVAAYVAELERRYNEGAGFRRVYRMPPGRPSRKP